MAALKKLRASLDPFQLGKMIERKIERIYAMANRRLSPQASQEEPQDTAAKLGISPPPGCGKAARFASLEIAARFPLSHSHDGELPVTFFNVSTGPTKVTFLNGLIRLRRVPLIRR